MVPDLSPLYERKSELERVIRYLEERIANAPEGHLVICAPKNGRAVKYYRRMREPGNSEKTEKKTYIPSGKTETAKALADKGYCEAALVKAKRELAVVSVFLKKYPAGHFEDIYESLAPARRKLITPLQEPDEVYAERWLQEEYPRMGFREGDVWYMTARGEKVRSKSELIIADWLFNQGIPYRYEFPLTLWDPARGREVTLHPDFTILDPVTRKCFYLEHFGMMDDEGYYRNAMEKIALYEANGYFEGEQMLYSFESAALPLNIRRLGNKITHFCVSEKVL